jgi:hypothetical protein
MELEKEKLKHMLSHWLEHSREHTAKYEEWAEKLESDLPDVARLLRNAAKIFRDGERVLEDALKKI